MALIKKMQPDDFQHFEKLHHSFINILTWTKEKKEYKKEMLDLLEGLTYDIIIRKWNYPKFSTGIRYKTWEYENICIPKGKKGFFKKYQNEFVFILSIKSYSVYALNELIVIPSEYKESALYERTNEDEQLIS